MALPNILTSLHGRLFGIADRGAIVVNAFRRQGVLSAVTPAVLAASTAVSGTASETAFSTKYTILKNTLLAGTVIRVRFQGILTVHNGSDTTQIKVYIGGTSGTALLTGTATNAAANAIFCGEANIIIRTIGATGTLVGFGSHAIVPAASGTASPVYGITASTTVDTTADLDIAVSVTFSSSNAGNSARLDFLAVEIA